jgi:hypothetical protein
MAEVLEIKQKDGSVKQVTKGEFLSQKLFQIASTGDLSAIKMCLDNVDGPPVQQIDHSGSGLSIRIGGLQEPPQQIGVE